MILKYQKKIAKIAENADDENNDFKDKIKSRLESDYKDNEDFKEFANAIGVELSFIDKAKGFIGN